VQASYLYIEVTILVVLFVAIYLVIALQISYVWIFEYLGGPTFEWGGPIERVLESTPTPLFEQPLKFIAHGCTFERLRYMLVAENYG